MDNNVEKNASAEGTISVDKNEYQNSENDNLLRPSLSFESITFSDGQTLDFADDEIVVFVGPNNAGKSASLRELQNWIARSQSQSVIKNVVLRKIGTSTDLMAYLEKYSQKSKDIINLTYSGIGYNIHHNHIQYFDQPADRHVVAAFFSTRLATENRITGSDPAGAVALYDAPPSHPIHLLLLDPKLATRISGYFRRAFGKDLIVFRAGGSRFPLYVGQKPTKAFGEDELDKSYVDRLLAAAAPLQSQGDGMRSFATVLLHSLSGNKNSVQFLDEPEAFLHPPQARLLGEFIANQRQTKSQLFIATHSTEILNGLISGNTGKLRIIRIQREGDINRVKELSKEKTAEIANDTLTRYSNVFEGIFYEHVIICESDSDCLFYNALLNLPAIAGDQQPDVLFIHAAGKHRMGKLAATLKSLDVRVSVIADLDLLNEESTCRGLFEKLGGDWNDISAHWTALKAGVEELRPPLTAAQVKSLIVKELEHVDGLDPFPKSIERKIKAVFKTLSPWDIIKQTGRSGFRGSSTISHFDKMSLKCAQKGLWLVPVGELEGFCRSVEAGHGPAFVEKVLEERDITTDIELRGAREFVKSVWDAAKGVAS